MPATTPPILLVTPVWNDSRRLAVFGKELARALATFPHPIRWVIADDGSAPSEIPRLHALRDEFATLYQHVELHVANAHRGKGAIVREAWALAPDAPWFAFVDADGSVSPHDLLALLLRALHESSSVIAVRTPTANTRVVESPWRGFVHYGFLLAARLLLDLEGEDPQCGAKVLRGNDYRAASPFLLENGLAFDSELLATLQHSGHRWIEIPVNWVEKKGGKVRPLRDGPAMLAALIRLRRRLRTRE